MLKVSISFSFLPSSLLIAPFVPSLFHQSSISNAACEASIFEFLNLQMRFGPQAAVLTQPLHYAAVVSLSLRKPQISFHPILHLYAKVLDEGPLLAITQYGRCWLPRSLESLKCQAQIVKQLCLSHALLDRSGLWKESHKSTKMTA